jgi:hypothetical protein
VNDKALSALASGSSFSMVTVRADSASHDDGQTFRVEAALKREIAHGPTWRTPAPGLI